MRHPLRIPRFAAAATIGLSGGRDDRQTGVVAVSDGDQLRLEPGTPPTFATRRSAAVRP